MILILHCDTCHKEIGRSDINDAHSFMSLMALSHAGGPHGATHKLRPQLLIDMTDDAFKDLTMQSSSKHEITIQCNHTHCKSSVTYKDVPLILCSGMILVYHSGHEGHPLKVTIDGKDYAAL
jgi:hypothetical protein